ncbi:MAG: glycosyltransferase family 1 protein [Anaerolineales bacterium]|nr:glycosyltransferase family 1 protein [Anaerolineales bacterium]
MTITILAVGSQGDVQPYLALAVGLKNEGYNVRFAANSNFASLTASYGLEFFSIQSDSFEFTRNSRTQSWLDAESIPSLILSTNRVIRPMLSSIMRDVFAACEGSDAVIYHSYALPFVHYFCEQLNIPCIPASLHPMPTRSYPAILSNMMWSPSKTFNLLTHLLVHQISWQVFLPVVRKHWNGKTALPLIGPYREILKGRTPILCGYSPAVLPTSEDLPKHVTVTGYWFLDPQPDWQPDPALTEFLQSAPRPIYIGFGSMGNPAKNQVTGNIILKALKKTGTRAILSTGWSGLGTDQPLPRNVFLIKNTPHRWLFPQMAAIVHHGGAGTTGAALSAGVPNVVVPHFGDQYYWGKRVAELGVGPEPIARKKLSVERLAAALSTVLHDSGMREQAASLGAKISAEDGVARAVEIIRKHI